MLRTDGRLAVFGSYLVARPRSNPIEGYQIYTVPDVSLWAADGDPNHQWDYDMHQRLVNRGSGLCLAVKKLTTNFPLLLVDCTDETRARRWVFQTRREMYREYQHKFDLKLDTDSVW
ncbi:unnamed protein product [Lymnaea stagnalis]|uniref:Ricin B lectin domain-containing protein n=1 Tax=Lymnaea stagnalis TaxID=6523 RepID=A0AAV2HME6_LYMST